MQTSLIIFGITGDLSHRKLLPALYRLIEQDVLPEHIQIIGISRRNVSIDEVIHPLYAKEGLNPDSIMKLGKRITMHQMDLENQEDYHALATLLQNSNSTKNLFYLSMPPQTFGPVISNLAAAGLQTDGSNDSCENRLIIEKPFGHDLDSAIALVEIVSEHFTEKQIYRIDHYLAKETAQNILTFRFHNPIFEETWNRRFVKNIRICALETIGIEGRAVFYERIGALRDLIQSHLLQLLALVAMEQPATMTADDIHKEKLRLLQAIEPLTPETVATHAIRGQYATYRDEVQNPASTTETFAAIKLHINNERWQGIPIYLETGKALSEKSTLATITYCGGDKHVEDNPLTMHIQPNEGISLGTWVKRPGLDNQAELAEMDFRYQRTFKDAAPEAYERVFMDAIRGDQTLFASSSEVIRSWEIIDAILQDWPNHTNNLKVYPAGSSAEELNTLE